MSRAFCSADVCSLQAQRCSEVPTGQRTSRLYRRGLGQRGREAWAHVSSLFGGLKTWCSTWTNPSSSLEQREWFCQQGPGRLSLSCATLLKTVPWATCAKWPSSQLARHRLAAQLCGRHVPRLSGLRGLGRNLKRTRQRWVLHHTNHCGNPLPGTCDLRCTSQTEPDHSRCVLNIFTFYTESFGTVTVFI